MIRNRKVGPFLATMLVASNMVGSGIFLLPATLASVGSITILGWVIASVGALLIAALLAKLGQVAPRAGGPCIYAGEALGPYMGMQASVIYWIACWVGNIAIAIAATSYLASFVPALTAPLTGAFATVGIIWLLALLNIFGPRIVCGAESFTMAFGAIPLLLAATVGWLYFDPDIFRASWNVSGEPAMRVIPESLILVFWAFIGVESASIAAGVVENPNRNVPIATVAGVLVAALIYIASCAALMGLVPAADLAKSTAPFAEGMRVVMGSAAGAMIAVMALVKAIGTLAGWVLVTAQVSKAAAERGVFPAVFARVDRYGIPVPNLLIMATLMTAVVFATISPTLSEQFSMMIEVAVILGLLIYVYASLSVWHYAKLEPASDLARYKPLAVIVLLFCTFVIAYSGLQLLKVTAIILALTVPLYFMTKKSVRGAALNGITDTRG